MVEVVVFAIAGAACLVGAVGVVLSRNPVHAALMLVMTLFGIAVLFVGAAGALHRRCAGHRVRRRHRGAVPVRHHAAGCGPGRRALAGRLAGPTVDCGRVRRRRRCLCWCGWLRRWTGSSRAPRSYELEQLGIVGADADAAATGYVTDVSAIARSLFSDYVYAFELTSLLLIVAVIGTVILARRSGYSEHDGADGRRAR